MSTSSKTPSPQPPWSVWLSPEALVVLAAAGVTSSMASMPMVLLPGAFAYGVLTWLRWGRWKDGQGSGDRDLAPLSPDLSGLAQPLRSRVEKAVDTQRVVLESIVACDAPTRVMLRDSAENVRALVASAVTLAHKQQELERHLQSSPPTRLSQEMASLVSKLNATQDEAAREGFRRAIEQHRQKTAIIEELRARRDRSEAQLTALSATLETVAAQIVRIRSAEAQSASQESARIAASLQAVSIDVQALAESIEETEGSRLLRP